MWSINLTAALQLLATIAGIIGVLIASFRAIAELHASRQQRERDLRWRQAEAASQLLEKASDNHKIQAALLLLEGTERPIEIAKGEYSVVAEPTLLRSLRVIGKPTDTTEAFIRECLDDLFLFYAKLEHYIRSELVRFEDVKFPADYHVRAISQYKPYIIRQCKDYGHERTLAFLARFPAWANASDAA